MFSCQIQFGSAATAMLALSINRPVELFTPIEPEPELVQSIVTQQARAKEAGRKLEIAQTSSRGNSRGDNDSSRGGADAITLSRRYLKKAARLRDEMEATMQSTWRSFAVSFGFGTIQMNAYDRLGLDGIG